MEYSWASARPERSNVKFRDKGCGFPLVRRLGNRGLATSGRALEDKGVCIEEVLLEDTLRCKSDDQETAKDFMQLGGLSFIYALVAEQARKAINLLT
jgi:hypothetical protein